MNTIQKLDSIFIEYTKLKDNIKVTRKVVNSENKQLLSKTYLASEQIQDIQIDLQNLIVHIEEWFFVTAWAVFERGLIEFFHKKMDVINSVTPMTFGEKLKEKTIHEMEYWKNNDRLDLLKTFIDSNDIGDIKQFVNYRDWLAHKNPKKEVNRPATPETVYEKMKTILDELDKQS